jgi:hypothetical protein
MTAAASARTAWRTSSHSGANGDCIEVARPTPGVIAVRDSKDPGGSTLAFPGSHWTAFTAAHKKHTASPAR